MLKTFFNSDLRAGKKYQQQFSNGDSAQRLHVLNQINEAKAAGSLNDIPSELQRFFNNALAVEQDIQVKIALLPWIDDLDALASLLEDGATAQPAARRLVELTPADSPLNDNPWLVAERFNTAPADQVRTLARIATTSEQMATLAIRAPMTDLSDRKSVV